MLGVECAPRRRGSRVLFSRRVAEPQRTVVGSVDAKVCLGSWKELFDKTLFRQLRPSRWSGELRHPPHREPKALTRSSRGGCREAEARSSLGGLSTKQRRLLWLARPSASFLKGDGLASTPAHMCCRGRERVLLKNARFVTPRPMSVARPISPKENEPPTIRRADDRFSHRKQAK